MAEEPDLMPYYHEAKATAMGIEMERQCIATKDSRTRHWHGMADGQRVGVDEPFTVGGEKLMFPGDKSHGASGWNIYNCRCAVRGVIKGHGRKRETYEEWLEKQKRLENSAEYANIVLGDADTDVLRHRRTGENNRQIINKATYHKLINPVVQKGGMIITASDDNKWMDYLDRRGATAVTLEDVIIFRPDATTTEVLEEVYHFNQNRASLNNQYPSQQRMMLNEIDAQEYLIRVADKYKIPQSEREETKALLEFYRNQMEDMKKAGEWID